MKLGIFPNLKYMSHTSWQEHQRMHTYLLLSGARNVEDWDGSEEEEVVGVKKLSEV